MNVTYVTFFSFGGADLGLISGLFSSSGFNRSNRLSVFRILKIAALVLAAIFLIHPSSFAFHLTLEWDPNIDKDLAGYIVYYGTTSRDYQYDVDIGDETSVTISGLVHGKKYYFAVTAYDIDGNESAYSAEIAYSRSGPSGSSGSAGVSGGGAGGCFISSAVDGRWSVAKLMVVVGVLLTGMIGLLIKRRGRPSVDLSDF